MGHRPTIGVLEPPPVAPCRSGWGCRQRITRRRPHPVMGYSVSFRGDCVASAGPSGAV